MTDAEKQAYQLFALGQQHQPAGLAKLFTAVWDAYLGGVGIDAYDLEKLVEQSGLTEWRPATEQDVQNSDWELEVGDNIIVLTDEGKRVINEGRK